MGQPEDGKIQMQVQASPEHAGLRLDQVATELFGGFSRARLQEWIKSGALTVNGEAVKPKQKLVGSEQLALNAVLAATGTGLAAGPVLSTDRPWPHPAGAGK